MYYTFGISGLGYFAPSAGLVVLGPRPDEDPLLSGEGPEGRAAVAAAQLLEYAWLISNWARFSLGSIRIAFLPNDLPK